MKLKLHPLWVLLVFVATQTGLELAKEFNMVGAAALRNYDRYDWLVLGVGVLASVGITIKALIDTSVQDYKNGKDKNETSNTPGPDGG